MAVSVSPRDASGPCVFCDILEGRGDPGGAPVDVVAERGHFVALLDRAPLFWGHTLMVPRAHVPTFDLLPGELAADWFSFAQELVGAVESAMGAEGSLMIVNNVISQSVPHAHLHLIPRSRGDGLRFWLGPRHPYESDEHRLAVAASIRERLAGGAA